MVCFGSEEGEAPQRGQAGSPASSSPVSTTTSSRGLPVHVQNQVRSTTSPASSPSAKGLQLMVPGSNYDSPPGIGNRQ